MHKHRAGSLAQHQFSSLGRLGSGVALRLPVHLLLLLLVVVVLVLQLLVGLVAGSDHDALPHGHLGGDACAALVAENLAEAAVAENSQQSLKGGRGLQCLLSTR